MKAAVLFDKSVSMTALSRTIRFLAILVAPGIASAASFQGLGVLPGGQYPYSKPMDLSFDGSVVVGESQSASGMQAFRWTLASGMVGLGHLGGEVPFSSASRVSGDGQVVVGNSRSPLSGDRAEGFRWTAGTGMVGLGVLLGGDLFSSLAFGVSADGSVVSGSSTSTLSPTLGEAYRWTPGNGMVGLGVLPGNPNPATLPLQLSADGRVVVGWAFTGNGREAFRWSEVDGLVAMGDLPGGFFHSEARGASSDGSVIVGYASAPGPTAFRWTSAGGMQSLGHPPGGISSEAWDVSADGAVVVGVGDIDSVNTPLIWDESHGPRNLVDILVDLGLGPAIQGWRLYQATAVSADGTVVTGWGYNPQGTEEAWLVNFGEATVVEVPTASGEALAFFAALLVATALVTLRLR